MVDALGRVGGVTPQSLWAITSDSLATRLLAETQVTGAADAAERLAHDIAAGSLRLKPSPRFVRVPGRAGASRTYVHRVSCCLLYASRWASA